MSRHMKFVSINIAQRIGCTDAEAFELSTIYAPIIRRYLCRYFSGDDLEDACQESLWLALTESWADTMNGKRLTARRAAKKWLYAYLRLIDRRHVVIDLDERRSCRNSGPVRVELREVKERIAALDESERRILLVAAVHGHVPGDWRKQAGLSRSSACRLLQDARRKLGKRNVRRKIRTEVVRLLRDGWPSVAIAERFGVCRQHITAIASQEKIGLTATIGDRTVKRLIRDTGKGKQERY